MSRTLLDVQLARLLYPLLIELAGSRQTLTYTQLIEKAKTRYPDNQRVANLIPVRMGRILWVIYNFVHERGLPPLTLIIVSATNNYPGKAMWNHDCHAEQQRCFEYDWSHVDHDFDLYGQQSEKCLTPLIRISREQAKKIMSSHYLAYIGHYPKSIKNLREPIIENIMNGMPVEKAFQAELSLLQ